MVGALMVELVALYVDDLLPGLPGPRIWILLLLT